MEPTIDELQKIISERDLTISEQVNTIIEKDTAISDVSAQLETANAAIQKKNVQIDELSSGLIEANLELEEKDKQLSEYDKEVDKLTAALNAKGEVVKAEKEEKKPINCGPHEVGGKTVKFNFPKFQYNGKKYTAEDAALDEDLVNKILGEKGQKICREME